MNNMIAETEFYIYNTSGLLSSNDLSEFCSKIAKKSMFHFELSYKDANDTSSATYATLSSEKLIIRFYDEGYLLKVEGDLFKCIVFLYEFDRAIKDESVFYISPTQRLEEDSGYLFPRGSKIIEISFFIDKIFNNNEYSRTVYERFESKEI